MGIPMLKIRWSRDRLIFNMWIPYTGKRTSLYWDGPLIPVLGTNVLNRACQLGWLLLDFLQASQWKHHESDLMINSSLPGRNGRLFADDIFRCIFVSEKFCILIKNSLKFVPEGPINNNLALRRIGDKPLSEPMLDSLMHICRTRGRWVLKSDNQLGKDGKMCTTHLDKFPGQWVNMMSWCVFLWCHNTSIDWRMAGHHKTPYAPSGVRVRPILALL